MAASDPDATTIEDRATVDFPRSGFVPPSPADLAARIPGLEVTGLLGHGGMGLVYKGRQPFLDRDVAIKVIRPDLQADDDFQGRFLAEARTLARLRHPYIVTVFDAGMADGLCYLVMEYVEGSTLRQRLAAGPVEPRDALDVMPQVAEALQHAHESGVVHRDVKPENVLIDPRGRVRLVDFGLATLFGPDSTAGDDRVAGTLGYMAPEQIATPAAVDHRADIYSAGVVFYEMLARELPGPDRVPPSRKSSADPRLDPIVLRATEHDRDRRYQVAALLHRDITAVSRTPESTIRLEQHVPAPPSEVFAAWLEPAGMSDWYAPTDDFGPTVAKVDPQVGGRYRVGMLEPGKTERRFVSGQYCRVDEPRTLSFTWAWETPVPDSQETQMTLEFRPSGSGTDVTLIHERFRDEGSRAGHAQGWQGCLGRLARKFGG